MEGKVGNGSGSALFAVDGIQRDFLLNPSNLERMHHARLRRRAVANAIAAQCQSAADLSRHALKMPLAALANYSQMMSTKFWHFLLFTG